MRYRVMKDSAPTARAAVRGMFNRKAVVVPGWLSDKLMLLASEAGPRLGDKSRPGALGTPACSTTPRHPALILNRIWPQRRPHSNIPQAHPEFAAPVCARLCGPSPGRRPRAQTLPGMELYQPRVDPGLTRFMATNISQTEPAGRALSTHIERAAMPCSAVIALVVLLFTAFVKMINETTLAVALPSIMAHFSILGGHRPVVADRLPANHIRSVAHHGLAHQPLQYPGGLRLRAASAFLIGTVMAALAPSSQSCSWRESARQSVPV